MQPTRLSDVAWLPMVATLLLGFTLLSHGLTDTSLWSDEGWTVAASAESSPLNIITEWVAVDVHPPLYFLGLNVWRRFTGDTVFEMRFYSVLLSMIGIALAYRLGRSLFGNRAGLLAALFYALHDLVITLTHEVRHYPQQIMLSVLAMWFYWRFWQRPSRERGIAFILAGAALLYTHYWGGFVLLALALHALVTRRHELKRFVYAFGGIALAFAPWLPILYQQVTLERPGGLPHALENSRQVYAVLLFQLVGIPELFWLVLAVIGAMGSFALISRRGWKPSPASLVPLLVAVLTPALSILINTAYPTLSFRSLAVIVPAVMVLAAHGLVQFRPREQYALLAFIILHSLLTRSAGHIERPPWPDIADYIATHSDRTDITLLENDTDEHALVYYLEQSGIAVDYAYTESTRELHPDDYPAYLTEVLDGKNGVWVAKLGWPALADIRPTLAERGFADTVPEFDYGMYNDRPILLWRMDRAQEVSPLAVFGGIMRLMRAEAAAHPDSVTVNLLWSATDVPERDYTISAFITGRDGTFANHDSYPLDGLSPTSSWQPGTLHYDGHPIATQNLPPGVYQVGIQVYYFTDSTFSEIENIPVSDCSHDPDCRFIIVDEIIIE